jgi:hypothetical protein
MKNFRAADKSHAGGDEKHDINFHWPYTRLDHAYWTSCANSLELMELSSINKVSSCGNTGSVRVHLERCSVIAGPQVQFLPEDL